MPDDLDTPDWEARERREAERADAAPTPREERRQEALDDVRYGDLSAKLLRQRD